ncbi:MAG: Fe-S cluster assembly protein SufD [bacterium]
MMNSENYKIKEWYKSNFEKFEKNLNGESKTFFHQSRKDAFSKIDDFDFPTQKVEEWKYTNISPILKHNFVPASIAVKTEISKDEVKNIAFENFESHLLVFVNGIFSKDLSSIDGLPQGVIIDSLNNILENNPDILQKHHAEISKSENIFTTLNAAYAYDGFVAIVPDGKIVGKPVQILYLNGSGSENILSTPRNFISVGKDAQLKVIAHFMGVSDNTYFTDSVTDVVCGENSVVEIYKIQNESNAAFHIERTSVSQKNSANFSHHNLSFGGALARNDIYSVLDGEHIESHLYGLYLANEKQHVDTHTFIDHAKPNSFSNEVYKGILDDESHGVFGGKILVRQDAQKTNAYQSNKTVLLSKNANIDTKPQLEIYADDVKCSHGATVGHLDDNAYFYIRSRGVPDDLAKSMLIHAFANDVIEAVKIEPLRESLNHMIFEHLHRVEI